MHRRSPTCLALIEAGTDIDYDGISGPLTFTGNGEPIVASYGLLTMGNNNRIDPAQTSTSTSTARHRLRRSTNVPVDGQPRR